MVSWKLISKINDKTKNSLLDKIPDNCVLESYICSCGYNHFLIKHPNENNNYHCKKCNNEQFYNANSVWKDSASLFDQYLENDFIYKYEIKKDIKQISLFYTIEIPIDINYSTKKINYKKMKIFSFNLKSTGEYKENSIISLKGETITKIYNYFEDYLNKDNYFNLPQHPTDKLTTKRAIFFLKNKYLKDFEFCYWDDIPIIKTDELHVKQALMHIAKYPKSKSVKRELYKNYQRQMSNTKKFESAMIVVFFETIKNISFLKMLLRKTFTYSTYKKPDKEGLLALVTFFKKYYTEKQIRNFFLSQKSDFHGDLLYSIIGMYPIIEYKLKKRCNINPIYDEFTRIYIEHQYETKKDNKFSYSKVKKKQCYEIEGYQVKLPNNVQELYDWGDSLQNELAVYLESLSFGIHTVFGFFKNKNLLFFVDIFERNIETAKGKKNRELTKKENDILLKWFKQYSPQIIVPPKEFDL